MTGSLQLTAEEDRGQSNARCFLETLVETFEELDRLQEIAQYAEEVEEKVDELEEDLRGHALSVEVRSGWATHASEFEAEEYTILVTWGGPACRVHGTLNYGQPDTAEIQYQDWGTPWTELSTYGYLLEKEGDQPGLLDHALALDQLVLRFAQLFYFEELDTCK